MTSQSNGRPQVSKPTVSSSLYVRVKYNNTLPDIPFDPKFLVNPLDIRRFVDYETTSLEQNAKHELITPTDLGVDIDLILPDRYAVPRIPEHDPDDERLLNDDESQIDKTKKSPRDKPHSSLHNKVVPWLKKTEYISTEYNRYGSSNEKAETKVGYNVRKNLKVDEVFLDKESQIKAIDATFETAKVPVYKHPTKPDVTATRVLPVLPDFDSWKYDYVHVKFDSEPADASQADCMSHAILKGAVDEEKNENMVKYFLPDEVTMSNKLLDQHHGIDYIEDKEYEYRSVRDYGWSFKDNTTGLKDDFFFCFHDEAVHYNELTLEVSLKKKRSKASTITTLIVKHRDWEPEELARQEVKMKALDKPSPSVKEDHNLTAESLEESYENTASGSGVEQGRASGVNSSQDYIASPSNLDQNNDGSGSSASSSSSSPGTSTPESSSMSSSSEDESDDGKKSDDNDDSPDD